MEPKQAVTATMLQYGIAIAGNPIRNAESDGSYIVNVAVVRDAHGRQEPTQKRLVEAKEALAAQGIATEYILVNQRIEHAEQNLRASMLASHGELIRNVYLTTRGALTEAWIETKVQPSAASRNTIEANVKQFGHVNRIPRVIVRFMSDERIATSFEVLSALRKLSPVSGNELRAELEARKFSIPSADWIARRFDALRKAGLIAALADRRYAVTLEGLHRLGTRKGRASADIARLLALARRGA